MSNNWVESAREWFDRKSGLLYTTYLTTFVIFNWKFFYVMFFSSDKVGSDRIAQGLYEFTHRTSLIWSEYYIIQFIFPAAISFIIIKYLPLLNNAAYIEYLNNEKVRKLAKAQRDSDIARITSKYKAQELSKLEEVNNMQEEINRLHDENTRLEIELLEKSKVTRDSDEERWDTELKNEKVNDTDLFKKLMRIHYSNSGVIADRENWNKPIMNAEELAKADTLGLIEIDGGKLSLTKKGKYFISNSLI